ncbi:MAG: AarF/ABC1/UbiB kinase family protein, partial [Hyphomicrobiales bacterium]|nr:AarF/ABC1/UbiB kinase family protein [Hyphomicrobiales bacterium]
ERVTAFEGAPPDERNAVARAMFSAYWRPLARVGAVHGDPHLGNYTVFRDEGGAPAGVNLFDFGCVRAFPPAFVGGVVDLYRGLMAGDRDRVAHAYETWGFRALSAELIEALNIWARFLYGPLMDDRVRAFADGVEPAKFGRAEAGRLRAALERLGPVTPPREFVFMDRAAIGVGAVYLRMRAELNFHRMFEESIEGFSVEALAGRQSEALAAAGLADAQAAAR